MFGLEFPFKLFCKYLPCELSVKTWVWTINRYRSGISRRSLRWTLYGFENVRSLIRLGGARWLNINRKLSDIHQSLSVASIKTKLSYWYWAPLHSLYSYQICNFPYWLNNINEFHEKSYFINTPNNFFQHFSNFSQVWFHTGLHLIRITAIFLVPCEKFNRKVWVLGFRGWYDILTCNILGQHHCKPYLNFLLNYSYHTSMMLWSSES